MLKTQHKITSMVLVTALAGTAFAGNARRMPDLLPPNPHAGECYARVEIPAQYRSEMQTVLSEEAHADFRVTQPELRSRQEHVLIKEASVRYNVRQPTYKSVTDQIMVRPSYKRLSVTRPQFSTVTETVGVSKPRLVWKRGNPANLRSQGYIVHSTADAGQGGRGYRSTSEYGRTRSDATLCGPRCEIWCLVEAPGQSVSYSRKVMTSPGEVQSVVVPAKYNTITKQVVADPGGVEEIPIPAEYRAITVEEVVRSASVHKVTMPPKYSKIAKKVLVSPERYEWRRVVCEPRTRSSAAQPVAMRAKPAHMAAPTHTQYNNSAVTHSSSTSRHQPRIYGDLGTQQTRSYTSTSYATDRGHVLAAPVQNVAPTSEFKRGQHNETNSAAEKSAESHYFGSDLPTYSEDYTKPAVGGRRGAARRR